MPVSITKRPVTVTAERYGNPTTGKFEEGSVDRIAAFLLGHAPTSSAETLDVVRPATTWADDAAVEILDVTIHHAWLPLALGDWVVCNVQGEFYPCANSVLRATYTFDDDAR